jgi:hypothetical protein
MKHSGVRRVLLVVAAVVLSSLNGVAGDSEREPFEGYVYRGVDGQPLSAQSDEEIEKLLTKGEVVSRKKIPVGVTNPIKLVVAFDSQRVHASFKDVDRTEKNQRDRGPGGHIIYPKWRDWYGYDIAAYRLDRLLGLNRIPPTVERNVRQMRGSVTIWIEGSITERERAGQKIAPPDIARFNQQKQILRLFDNLIANRDSNLGNMLIDSNWRLWFIDFTRSFGTSKGLIYPEAVTHCDRRVLQALRDLDRETVTQHLSDYLTRNEIGALLTRRDLLVKRVDDLIREHGEHMVLFDSRPATEKAPWAVD